MSRGRSTYDEPVAPGAGRVLRPRFAILLVCILVCAALVRVARLGEQEFWLDELHSLLNSAAHRADFEALPYGQILHDVPRYSDLDADSTLPAVWRGMRGDSHPPLYFVLLRAWRGLAGDGEFLTRLPSALLSVLAIVDPNNAITASPMYLSIVPPWAKMMSVMAVRYWRINVASSDGLSFSLIFVNETMSQNKTVISRSAGSSGFSSP